MNPIAFAAHTAALYSSVAWSSMARRKWLGNAAIVLAASLILLAAQYEPAAAQNLDRLQQAADRLVQFFTGPFGRSVGAIAFIGMFLAAAFGYWSWGRSCVSADALPVCLPQPNSLTSSPAGT